MKELNLWKLWEICNKLSEKESELAEQDIYVHLLGHRSNYGKTNFEEFLNYYSFKIDEDEIIVFNNDPISWEDFSNNDYSYIPSILLSFADWQLENWMKNEIEKQIEQKEKDKLAEKEDIKQKIEYLQEQLNNL
jgi:hypothetical protein